MNCHICGIHAKDCKGWLARVNEKGVDGIWECRPMCGADLPMEVALVGALEQESPTPQAQEKP